MATEEVNFEKEISSSNIFEWFEKDDKLNQEVIEKEEGEKRDLMFYLFYISRTLEVLFFILFFIVIITYWYIVIQKNEWLNNSSSLDPFCGIVLWDIKNTDTYCSSIYFLNKKYISELDDLRNKQATQIIQILKDVYEIENFTKSNEIEFLLSKKQDRLKVLDILEEFDNLKRIYEPIDKDKIKCNNILLTEGNILSATCEASSSSFENVVWFNWMNWPKVKGTSISLAMSFLNFIEKTSKNFILMDKQKVFSSENIVWDDDGFKNKTKFELKLIYTPSNLSL